MDPTALLERIRERMAAITRDEDVELHRDFLIHELYNLDEWLSKGGFFPEQWSR